MSWSAIPTYNNTGVRNLSLRPGLAGVPLLGMGSVPDPNTEAELEAAGWDPQRIQILVQLNVTNEQLQSLPYPASEDEMTAAYNALTLQLIGVSAATPAPVTGTQFQNSLKASGDIPVGFGTRTPPPIVQANQLQTGQGLVASAQYGATATGNTLPATVVSVPPAYAAAAAPQSFEQWLTGNAGKILLAIAAIAILPPLVKKL